jgi:hypothetical protein
VLPRWPLVALVATLLAALAGLSACGGSSDGSDTDPAQVDATSAPDQGACRALTPDDAKQPSNATRTVPCTDKHTAETFAVEQLPAEYADAGYDATRVATYASTTCTAKLQEFLGADESTVMRSVLSWVWFRPSQDAWDKGARWFRCDVVGGSAGSSYAALPASADGLLTGRPEDSWMACVNGPSVQSSPKVPCTAKHNWRAVTTIKVGDPDDAYPGSAKVEATTKDYCSSSVAAWLGYPKSYDYGYTWFQRSEWDAGNRRSVCWAETAA